jgi:7-cyano-7-deazaguanine synthase
MGVVALTSGGIDSIVMCKLLEESGREVIPLFINYGQLGAKNEWAACRYLCKKMGLPKPVNVDLSGYGQSLPSGITSLQKDIYDDAFLPGRNLLFLLTAAAHAFSLGHKIVAIGLLKGNRFPDQTDEFIVNSNFAINSALDSQMSIVTPLIRFSKSEVISLAQTYGIPLNSTYSCHAGGKEYCGRCISCKEIINSGKSNVFSQFNSGEKHGK